MQNKECVYICDQFTDYHEQTLSTEIRARIDVHLAECTSCSKTYQELDKVLFTLHALPTQSTSPDFTETLLSKIDDMKHETAWHKLSHSTYLRVAGYAVAAGLVVALGLNVWLDPISPLGPNGSQRFADDQMQQDKQQEMLADQGDSSYSQPGDSLALRRNTINTASSSLQLVSDTQ